MSPNEPFHNRIVECSIRHIPAAGIAAAVKTGFQLTSDSARAKEAHVLIVRPPMRVDEHREADMSYVHPGIRPTAGRIVRA